MPGGMWWHGLGGRVGGRVAGPGEAMARIFLSGPSDWANGVKHIGGPHGLSTPEYTKRRRDKRCAGSMPC